MAKTEFILPTPETYDQLSDEGKTAADAVQDNLLKHLAVMLRATGNPDAIKRANAIDKILAMSDEDIAKLAQWCLNKNRES